MEWLIREASREIDLKGAAPCRVGQPLVIELPLLTVHGQGCVLVGNIDVEERASRASPLVVSLCNEFLRIAAVPQDAEKRIPHEIEVNRH